MASIFSVQNLHTFLRRKNFRPPGPPGPPSRPPGPERGGRRSPDRSPDGAPSLAAGAGLVSSAMLLLQKSSLVVGFRSSATVLLLRSQFSILYSRRPTTDGRRLWFLRRCCRGLARWLRSCRCRSRSL